VGGGVIGCEYASIFTALGVEVALVDGRDRVLPFSDAEISECLRERLAHLGVRFFLGERMSQIERVQNGVHITLQSGKTLEMEAALFAAGRGGVAEKLQLERAGVTLNKRGYIKVNENYRTSSPLIYAARDVIGFPALASTSMEQARVAICSAFSFQYKKRVASTAANGHLHNSRNFSSR
jgi:NAD(P) transhydrogenase